MIGKFLSSWSKFDPDATGIIEMSEFEGLMFELGEPLGWEDDLKNNLER